MPLIAPVEPVAPSQADGLARQAERVIAAFGLTINESVDLSSRFGMHVLFAALLAKSGAKPSTGEPSRIVVSSDPSAPDQVLQFSESPRPRTKDEEAEAIYQEGQRGRWRSRRSISARG